MASFQAKINCATGRHSKKIGLRRVQSSRQDPGQHVQSREGYWVAHQGEVNELLDRTAPKAYPDALVFASRFPFCQMRRPVDAQMPEVVETGGNRAIGLVKSRVQIDA